MRSSGKFEAVTRLGFAARGILYLLIGYLALRLGRTEDGAGSLEFLISPIGRILLVVMGLGFLGYGAWRLAEAAVDSEHHGSDAKGKAVRAGGAISGLVHFGLAWAALKLGLTDDVGPGSGDSMEQGAAAALEWPGGEIALVLAAGLLLVTGGYQLVKAAQRGFLAHLDPRAAHRIWVSWLGRAGYAARGIVFLMMAWLLWRAGRSADAEAAGGIGQAMDALPQHLQWPIAVGLFLFGLFSLVEARYRRINPPDMVQKVKRAAAG